MTSIITSRARIKPAVMADRVQLLRMILMTAHTAMMGDLIKICRPMDRSICTWVMSLVVRVMRLGTEKARISRWPKSAIL